MYSSFPVLVSFLAFGAQALAAPAIPFQNIGALVNSARIALPPTPTPPSTAITGLSSAEATEIEYTQCPSAGNVSSITIEPCHGGNGTLDSPCEFHFAQNYTITLSYTSTITSDRPRNNLIANETEEARLPNSRGYYPYSGQSFNGCSYTSCPVQANVPSVYTYEFNTLKSPFNALTFNVTDWLDGPSFLCAGFPIKFVL